MMISLESFYEFELKGKTPEQIMTVIRSLKRKIGRLKNIVENPNYGTSEWVMRPSERTQISMNREYLAEAKRALVEAGGEYTPSAAEQRAIDFNNDIPHIRKVVFSVGGFFGGYEIKTFTVSGDKVSVTVEDTLNPVAVDTEGINTAAFFEGLKDLHIGEWRRVYDTFRFGVAVMDGTQWELEIYFSNGRRAVKFCGDNAYPYNFDRLLELFEVEE